MECLTSYIGETDYLPAWDLQRRLHSKVASGEVPCAMLLVQHPHIYTIGRRGAQSDILASSEDLDQLGIETKGAGTVSLEDAAKKKGGTLNMQDLMELSGLG